MKRPIYILLFFMIVVGFAQEGYSQKNLLSFIEDLKTTEEFTKSKIPLQALKKGLALGLRQYELEKGIQNLSGYITKATHYMTEIPDMENDRIAGILKGHKKKLIKKDHFSEWLEIENEDEAVSLMILEENEEVTKVLLLRQHAQEIQLFEFSTRISKTEFNKIFSKKELKRI